MGKKEKKLSPDGYEYVTVERDAGGTHVLYKITGPGARDNRIDFDEDPAGDEENEAWSDDDCRKHACMLLGIDEAQFSRVEVIDL